MRCGIPWSKTDKSDKVSKSSMRCGIRIVQHKTHLYQGLKPYFRDLPNVFSP